MKHAPPAVKPRTTLMECAYELLIALRPFGFGVVYCEKGNPHSHLFNPNEPDLWARVEDPKMPAIRKHVWFCTERLR